jgi:predicted aldo/keto reductase-like oxidoreductase
MNKRFIKKLDMELSPLGFGVMRLPMDGDRFTDETYRLIALAMDSGINYFDTAYPYQKGRSEELIRRAVVSRYPRDTFHIADKLPVWECADAADMERIFRTQLDRLGVEYIDMYLLHGLHQSRWMDIYQKGVLDFLDRKKKEGRIRKVGFSLHDTTKILVSILDTFDWDFVQLQINYYDWVVQHAKESYECLAERDIPCLVMEPVGGGRLSKLPYKAESLLKELAPNRSISSWAIRYVASLPNVAVTLSGMSNEEQLNDNLSSFDPVAAMTGAELNAVDKVVKILRSYNTIPCTSCRYCVDECPKSIDIPYIFQRYNDYMMFDNIARFDIDYFAFIPNGKRADACIACGKCARKCPQEINIPERMKLVHNTAVGLSIGLDMERLDENFEKEKGSLLVCFGAGDWGERAQILLAEKGYQVDYFCDNAQHLWGKKINGIPVISPEQLRALHQDTEIIVLITSTYYEEIKAQLDKLGIPVSDVNKSSRFS